MHIVTKDRNQLKTLFSSITLPRIDFHKGENGRVLVIGGSSLFHSSSIWAAEVLSRFADIVHYSSIKENNLIFRSLKKKFENGIVVSQKDIPIYAEEDDVVLIGPGMVRKLKMKNEKLKIDDFKDLSKISDEGEYTHQLTKYLIEHFPHKKFVFDAGALQMMDPQWLTTLAIPAVVTPHQTEFEQLFATELKHVSLNEKKKIVIETAKKYHTVILLKAIVDIVSDGERIAVIEGGNAGLTKGGTGDTLAGLAAAFRIKEPAFTSVLLASSLLKAVGDDLRMSHGYWYNIPDIIQQIPKTLYSLVSNRV